MHPLYLAPNLSHKNVFWQVSQLNPFITKWKSWEFKDYHVFLLIYLTRFFDTDHEKGCVLFLLPVDLWCSFMMKIHEFRINALFHRVGEFSIWFFTKKPNSWGWLPPTKCHTAKVFYQHGFYHYGGTTQKQYLLKTIIIQGCTGVPGYACRGQRTTFRS